MNEPLGVPATALDRVEAAIRERIRDFEVPALLDLLEFLGYGPGHVRFRGHLVHGPQPTLLHDIQFPPRSAPAHDAPKVVVTLNLGLLSCRSPLPTYFRRLLADMDIRDGLLELLDLLDHSLLQARLRCDRLDRSVDDWQQARCDLVRSFGLDSPLGLEWLFRRVFPELGVAVRRIRDQRRVPFGRAVLGGSVLGECCFGPQAQIGVHDLEVVLVCEDAQLDATRSWVAEGDRRLRDVVFPLLDEVCMSLTVTFVLLDRGARARLSPPSRAGHDPMWSDELTGRAEPPTRLELYRGALPRSEPDTDALELELELELGEAVSLHLNGDTHHDARAIGRAVALRMIYVAPGQRHEYEATVHWGARAWYRDEPRAISLRCRGVIEAPPTASAHPRLWAWLRDEARRRIADRSAQEAMATAGSDRVTVAVIDALLADGDLDRLYALVHSRVTPSTAWDDDAWRRFSSWSAG